jgi:hypothetical protein
MRSAAHKSLIDKNGPTGARGASFSGSWTPLLTPSALREPLQPLVPRPAKRPKLRWAAELAKPAAAVQLSFTRSSGCAKNSPSHTHKAAMYKASRSPSRAVLDHSFYTQYPQPSSPSIQYGPPSTIQPDCYLLEKPRPPRPRGFFRDARKEDAKPAALSYARPSQLSINVAWKN